MASEVVRKSSFKKTFVPEQTITSAQSAPLRRVMADVDLQRALDHYGKTLLRKVRDQIKQQVFSDAAKKRLSKALQIKLYPKSLRLTSKDPLWGYLVNGRRQQQMTWLQKSPVPIPIVTESGKVIFRSATARSMRDGKWVHPGRPALNIVEQAKKEARKLAQTRLKKEIVTQLRQIIG